MAKILLIDDSRAIRSIIRQILTIHDHEVMEATNGREGIEIFEQDPADMVITDINMPEKCGIETIVELRRSNPGLPIIAISGGGRTGNMEFLAHAKKFGAQRVLKKPVESEALMGAVNELLPE